MLFNSLSFIIFFPIVVVFFFALPQKYRWMLLLAASYFFYLSFEIKYFFLIATSTLVSYYTAIWMGNTDDDKLRKKFLLLNLITNLGILFVFKYFNFAIDTANFTLEKVQIGYQIPLMRLMLPLGISFYTFQIIGYTLDVYYERVKPQKHLGIFALYVSFFPQLVAGPIERGGRLLPQFFVKHKFDYNRVKTGLIIMLWGYFKKLVIADRISVIVDQVYGTPEQYGGVALIITTVLFAIQIYCDFSGYTDIAIGAAKIMGFDLMINFKRPFISKNISEFWRRWHISLSTWARDYIYEPIAFKRKNWGMKGIVWAIFVTFSLLGLWHGAKWAFVFFGVLQGLAFYYEMFTKNFRAKLARAIPAMIYNKLSILLTFSFFCFTSIFFRADNIIDGFHIAGSLDNGLLEFISNFTKKLLFEFSLSPGAEVLKELDLQPFDFVILMFAIFTMFQFEKFGRDGYFWEVLEKAPLIARWTVYAFIFTFILMYGEFNIQEFIYFQF